MILHWNTPAAIAILPDAPSGYTPSPSFPSGIEVNMTGYLVSTGQRQASDHGRTFLLSSGNYKGSFSLTLAISGEHVN